jgi:hypothetical protein
MPVESHISLFHAEPDKALAQGIEAGLWSHRIECCPREATSIADQLEGSGDDVRHVFASRFLIAVLSAEPEWRFRVIKDIVSAYRLTGEKLREVPIVYIATPDIFDIASPPAAAHRHMIDPTRTGGVAEIVAGLMQLMGNRLVLHCQEAWKLNKKLDLDAWQKRNTVMIAHAPPGVAEMPQSNAVFGFVLGNKRIDSYIREDVEKVTVDDNKWTYLLVAERSPAEGSVGQIFKCLKRLDDFHANPKRAGSVGKRRKGFGDPIWRFAESLRFACLR